jgi:hypothetical protein
MVLRVRALCGCLFDFRLKFLGIKTWRGAQGIRKGHDTLTFEHYKGVTKDKAAFVGRKHISESILLGFLSHEYM